MSRQLDDLYRVQRRDFPRAGAVLADAFEQDPVWKRVLEETEIDLRRTFFQGPVRYCSTGRPMPPLNSSRELQPGFRARRQT